jgi:hypothetical protein
MLRAEVPENFVVEIEEAPAVPMVVGGLAHGCS